MNLPAVYSTSLVAASKLNLVVPVSLLDFGLLPQMQILVGNDWTAGLNLHVFDRE